MSKLTSQIAAMQANEEQVLNPALPIMVSIQEFSRLSGICEYWVRQFVKIKGFPHMKVGSKYLIHWENARRWLTEQCARQASFTPGGGC